MSGLADAQASFTTDGAPEDERYLGAEKRIQKLQEKVAPLTEDIIATPMWPAVARIMNLSVWEGRRKRSVEEIKTELDECERLLSEMAFDWVKQIIAPVEESKVFQTVANANIFKKMIGKAVGSKLSLPDGGEILITRELAKFLTRFDFSIGTPPVTKKGIETIERILFGGQLGDVYGFRNLLGVEVDVFDRFMKNVDRMVTQSTHYTTADEKKEHEKESRDFPNMEGMKGFTKTVVTGSAKTATRLIRERLFSKHKNGHASPEEGSVPLTEVEVDLKNPAEVAALLKQMEEKRTHFFIAKISSAPYNVFTSDLLREKWQGVIGRLVFVENSNTSSQATSTMVYSFIPDITEELGKHHVKDSGMPANTQLNLRAILEGFSDREIGGLKAKVAEKIADFENQGVLKEGYDDVRKKEWLVSDQKDYVTLKRFQRFLTFIEKIQSKGPEALRIMQEEMMFEEEQLEMNYFFKELGEKNYRCICVPQGGGRRQLGLIGKYHLGKHRQRVSDFREKYLNPDNPTARIKLETSKRAHGIPEGTTETEFDAAERAEESLAGPDQAIRDYSEFKQSADLEGIRERIRQAVYKGSRDVESIVRDTLLGSLDHILGKNVPGILRTELSKILKKADFSAALKFFDRGPFKSMQKKFFAWEGQVRRFVNEILAEPIQKGASKVRRSFEEKTSRVVEIMLNNIEQDGAFEPHLVMAALGWSFGDVLVEDDFPSKNYINIDMNKDGGLILGSLEKNLEEMRESLEGFPELFELFCSSILLVFNDPHNPTSSVADRETKIKLLGIASKYGLPILADEAYLKLVDKETKDMEGDDSFSAFYELNKPMFPNPVTIYGSLPSTKWGMGAGRRTGNVLTNDTTAHSIISEDEHQNKITQSMTFEDFIRSEMDGINTLSLYMDIETLKAGIAVKDVCKVLEETMDDPARNPVREVDELLGGMQKEITSENFQSALYFKLLKARNELDRLSIRTPNRIEFAVVARQYFNHLVSDLKTIRLDKQTAKDTEERMKSGKKAVKRLSKEFPGLESKYIEPHGPFYLCLKLDETGKDKGLTQFCNAITKARKIDGVSVGEGEVRFSFGGMLDGTPESYELQGMVFETDLRLILQYWEKFKAKRAELNKNHDPDSSHNALKILFPGGETNLVDTIQDKQKLVYFSQLLNEVGPQDELKTLVKLLGKVPRKEQQAGEDPIPEEQNLEGGCDLGDLMDIIPTKDLGMVLSYWRRFKSIKAKLEAEDAEKDDEEQDDVQEVLDPSERAMKQLLGEKDISRPEQMQALKKLISSFGKYKEKGKAPLVFQTSSDASKYVSKIQPDSPASIVTIQGVACKKMSEFIDSKPFKTLFDFYVLKVKDKVPQLQNMSDGEILGNYGAQRFQEKVASHQFAKGEKKVFAKIAEEVAKIWFSDDTTKVLAMRFAKEIPQDMQSLAIQGLSVNISRFTKEFLDVFLTQKQYDALNVKPSFQAGYQSIKGAKAGKNLQPWMRSLIENAEFAGQTVPTDPNPEMVTGSTARVAGHDYGIYKRDGDGESAPPKEYFRERLGKFMEKMNPKDYVCKMVQIGPTKTLLVMNRSYSHYMADEMRLFPQFEITPADLESLEPDAISFMGIPRKVMGDDYKIGYYMEENLEGKQIPVSWVDAEQLADYGGYLKKPLLTVANECVKEAGGMPVHGSAFTIVFKNGLRKTLVIGGDSGAGKSETIIAMVEKAIKSEGEAADVESIEMLAGDMLSMYEGGDGQVYMMGTEEGDFMRMSDISGNWKSRFRDKLKKASTTNKNHPTNPRTTIGGLCDPNVFLRPVRVNMFYYIDNYSTPKGSSFEEEKDPGNLLSQIYANGYRREKGTSGDQPNLRASILDTDIPDKYDILKHHGKLMDSLLGWQTTLAESGKVKQAILSFKDKPGMIFRANAIVQELFEGRSFTDEEGKKWTIQKTKFDVHKNQYGVIMTDESGTEKEAVLDRSVFDKIYNPVASTYCGNPFVHPKGMGAILKRFGNVMKKAGVITGVLHSQLSVPGKQFEGPAKAAEDAVKFIKKDQRINNRFERNKTFVYKALKKRYGDWFIGQKELPEKVRAYNLLTWERYESNAVKLVDRNGKHIDIRTPMYKYDPTAGNKPFEPSLATPEVSAAINTIMESNDYKKVNLEKFDPEMKEYSKIKYWNSKEELVYQVMIINGYVRLGDDHRVFRIAGEDVKKAVIIAEKIMERRTPSKGRSRKKIAA
jgi:hypothetical protein